MNEKEKDILKVKSLDPFGGNCKIFWHEESGGDVYRIWDMFFLFEIPLYGGEGRYSGAFQMDEIEKLVDIAHTWT